MQWSRSRPLSLSHLPGWREGRDHQDGPRNGPAARTGDATGSMVRHRAPGYARLRAARRLCKMDQPVKYRGHERSPSAKAKE